MARIVIALALTLGLAAAAPAADVSKKTAKKSATKLAAFEKADTNKDGTLSKAEFEKFLAAEKDKAGKVKKVK